MMLAEAQDGVRDLLQLFTGRHWFWGAILAACIVWYSTVTIYVAIRGALDIKHMLARLQRLSTWDSEPPP